jgi:hypothetical protein
MTNQLRIYTINRDKLDEFAQVWKQGVYPLRKKLGFTVSGVWMNRQTNQFIWVVSYNGPKTWEEMEKAYYSSPERQAMNPDPMQYIARIETYFVESVPVSS